MIFHLRAVLEAITAGKSAILNGLGYREERKFSNQEYGWCFLNVFISN